MLSRHMQKFVENWRRKTVGMSQSILPYVSPMWAESFGRVTGWVYNAFRATSDEAALVGRVDIRVNQMSLSSTMQYGIRNAVMG